MNTHDNLNIATITVGMFEVNCYLAFADTSSVLVIDPGEGASHIIDFLKSHDMKVAGYLLTHGHVDHISALAEVHDAYPADICIHSRDLEWAFLEEAALPPYYPQPRRPDTTFREVSEGDQLQWEDLSVEVIETPGHSPGGVCYFFKQQHVLFAGDTLLRGSVGRTDIPGGNGRTLANSLKKLKDLPGETVVYSGHGPSTTIEFERRTNFFMR